MKDWIKMSERKPTDDDMPVWLYSPDCKSGQECCVVHCRTCRAYTDVPNTHWKHAAADIPEPPKEPTQSDDDNKTFSNYMESGGFIGTVPYAIWRSALAYRDKQNAEDLKILDFRHFTPVVVDTIARLRRRCGIDK